MASGRLVSNVNVEWHSLQDDSTVVVVCVSGGRSTELDTGIRAGVVVDPVPVVGPLQTKNGSISAINTGSRRLDKKAESVGVVSRFVGSFSVVLHAKDVTNLMTRAVVAQHAELLHKSQGLADVVALGIATMTAIAGDEECHVGRVEGDWDGCNEEEAELSKARPQPLTTYNSKKQRHSTDQWP